MTTPKLTNSQLIDLLAAGYKLPEIGQMHSMKKPALERRMERLKAKHDCKTVTQLVVKLKAGGESAMQDNRNIG